MRPWQSECRTKFTVLEVVLEKSGRKDGGGECPQKMGAPSCSVQNAIGLLPNNYADGALFQPLFVAPYLDASAIARSSGWVGRRRGNDKPKH